MIISPRILTHQARLLARHRFPVATPNARIVRTTPLISRSGSGASSVAAASSSSSSSAPLLFAGAALVCAAGAISSQSKNGDNNLTAQCAAPVGSEPVMFAPSKEPATGILFPSLCNGMSLAGCGVRVKWGFVKVYAVGTYLDPLAMSMIKNQSESSIKNALLDPSYPRTIRIVMNRNLSIDKYTAAIIESLEPRMAGEDLEALEEFKKLNPPVDLIQGAEMEMTIRGDTLLYKNAVGGLGQIRSAAFTKALCDVYYGDEAVSPTHLSSVLSGVKNL